METTLFRRINTNYAPSELEIGIIRALVNERQAIVNKIDEEAKILAERRAIQTKFIDEYSALLSPVRRLPSDILSSIFLACTFPSSGRPAWPEMSNNHPAVILSHVSQQWRQITLDMPLLWSVIDIRAPVFPHHPRPLDSPSASEPYPGAFAGAAELYESQLSTWTKDSARVMDITKNWLSRSRDCPLVFRLAAVNTSDLDRNRSSTKRAVEFFSLLVDALCAVSTRWKEANFFLQTQIYTSRRSRYDDGPLLRFLRLTPMDVPLLETLQFLLDHEPIWTPPHIPVELETQENAQASPSQFKLLRAQSLRSLGLTPAVYERVIHGPNRNASVNWAGLSHLWVGRGAFSNHAVFPVEPSTITLNAPEALDILNSCPSLITCLLTFCPTSGVLNPRNDSDSVFTKIFASKPRVHLPYLKLMSIHGSITPIGFASLLSLPSLHTLSLLGSSASSAMGSQSSSGHVDWIQNFGMQLKTATSNYTTLSAPELVVCLQNLPNVTKLNLLGSHFSAPWVHSMHAQVAPAPPMPGQHFNTIRASIDDGLLANLTPTGSTSDMDLLCPSLTELSFVLSPAAPEFTTAAFLDFLEGRRHPSAPTRLQRVGVKFAIRPVVDIMKELKARNVDLDGFSLSIRHYARTVPTRDISPISYTTHGGEFDFDGA